MLEKPSLLFFDRRFSLLTGHEPYHWQRKLFQEFIAGRVPANLALPTGSGKTSTIACWLLALAWQKLHATVTLPRRLVWVVNRRKVVDQTSDLAERIADTIERLPLDHDLRRALDSMSLTGGIGVSTLRGEHEDNQEWSDDPSVPAIIVGTVGMVGSRLLLSGYGLSPRQRAQDAALLGNDALLVNDEAQISPAFARLIRLIGDARSRAEVPLLKPFVTMHVSATLDESSLARGVFPFDPAEETSEHFWKVYTAKKALRFRKVDKAAVLDTIVVEATKPIELLRRIVFVQRPRDVKFIARTIQKKTKSKVLTVTGTMRGLEREQLVKDPMFLQFLSAAPTLTEPAWLVCTSAAEVGIDISSDMMVMDMDSAEHLTQRLGRVNRFGEVESAVAVLVHEKNTMLSELSEAERKTLAYLHSLPALEGGVDASCKTMFERPAPAEAQGKRPAVATFTERDLALLSFTSVRHTATKPDVDALLHGAEASPAYVEIAWREELPQLLAMSDEEREDWLSSYRVLAHERLRELNYEVSRVLGGYQGSALLVESNGSTKTIKLPDELTVVDKRGKPPSALPRESLLVLPPGLAGLASGMLAEEENGNDVSGTADRFRFIVEGHTIRGEGREFSEEEFKAFLRQRNLIVKLRVGSEEVSLIHVVKKQKKARNTSTVWLDEHLTEVEQAVRDLCAKLDIPAELTEELVLAAQMHDAGKKHPNWQKAFNSGKMSARAIAKLVGRAIRQSILGGLRHEFVSLFEMDGNALAKQAVSAHHAWGRPHFPQRGYDPARARRENAAMNLGNMRRFVELQKRYGVYGLAYIEAILRAADVMASGNE